MLPSLQSSFEHLEAQRTAFTSTLTSASPAELDYHPAPGAWSIADVARHLSLTDKGTARVLSERRVTGVPRRTVLDAVYRAPALAMYFRAGGLIRARVPVKGVIPDADTPLDQVIARWGAARSALAAYLDTIEAPALGRIVYRHPFGGYMHIGDTLTFLRRHHDHHMRQVARIRNSWESSQ